MIKKSVIWFLVLAFLNFELVFDYAFASGFGGSGDYGGPSGGEVVAVVIGAAVVIGLIVFGVSKLSKQTPRMNNLKTKRRTYPKV